MKYYAGIGSRQTPGNILALMSDIAFYLSLSNYVLRSGAASGADSAFEDGCDKMFGEKEIFLPSPRFNNSESELYMVSDEAKEIARKFHPCFNQLGEYEQLLMSRNSYQVLGKDLKTTCEFIICWTEDGADGKIKKTSRSSGGTGQAIRLASEYNIPVNNLRNEETLLQWMEWIEHTKNYFEGRLQRK